MGLRAVGSHAEIAKTAPEGVDPLAPHETTVIFRCDEHFRDRARTCLPGDHVDVRVLVDDSAEPGSRWPNLSLLTLKAIVVSLHDEEGTVEVQWYPRHED